MPLRRVLLRASTVLAVASACGGGGGETAPASPLDGGAPAADARAPGDAAPPADAPSPPLDAAPPPCTTRITYGTTWVRPGSHPSPYDDVPSLVTWDGTCVDDGASSFALLSNGFKPYFTGHGGCELALDVSPGCSGAAAACATRISYGPAWLPPANHPSNHDDVSDRVLWNRTCQAAGSDSFAWLSNGWQPRFAGAASCELSLEYTQCGGLYQNPVVAQDCPDPGVLRDGARYVAACTSGGAADAFPIRVSSNLVDWVSMGSIFPAAKKPVWATGDFWAPEIHAVGGAYVAYFSARDSDGMLSVGAATAPTALGPFTDIGHPLVHDPAVGLIDASEYQAPNGARYLLWKEDGNAVGKPTPIHEQPLAPGGTSLTGSPSTLITNDQPWEGAVVEAPWMVDHGGVYYLFYSGNSYANDTYAVGVARAASPLGPFTKAPSPIVTTGGAWVGPGHCSVVDTPGGDTYMVYHAWASGHVNGAGDGRMMLTDRVLWPGASPTVPVAPSDVSLPLP